MTDDTFAKAQAERARKFGAPEGNDGIVRCDACPVLCRIRPGRAGACDRYANVDGTLIRTDPVVFIERAAEAGAPLVPFAGGRTGTARILSPERTFVTGIGAGTTYPDYKPAPFIVSSRVQGRRHRHRRHRGHLQLLRREGEDRHGPPSRPRAVRRCAAPAKPSATSPPPSTARRCSPSAACAISPAAARRKATSPATRC